MEAGRWMEGARRSEHGGRSIKEGGVGDSDLNTYADLRMWSRRIAGIVPGGWGGDCPDTFPLLACLLACYISVKGSRAYLSTCT